MKPKKSKQVNRGEAVALTAEQLAHELCLYAKHYAGPKKDLFEAFVLLKLAALQVVVKETRRKKAA